VGQSVSAAVGVSNSANARAGCENESHRISRGFMCDVLVPDSRCRRHALLSSFVAAGICQYFEEKLKRENPHTKKITYDIADLFAFIDSLADLATLTFDHKLAAYVPHNKQWIKGHSTAHSLRHTEPNKGSCQQGELLSLVMQGIEKEPSLTCLCRCLSFLCLAHRPCAGSSAKASRPVSVALRSQRSCSFVFVSYRCPFKLPSQTTVAVFLTSNLRCREHFGTGVHATSTDRMRAESGCEATRQA
jgi:hypothetical protein